MALRGIVAALLVSLLWIGLQNLWMFVRPAENRFRAMLIGYLISLPFLYVAYHWIAQAPIAPDNPAAAESPAMGLFHACFLHLLLYFCYGECFYHVERSVTLRLLVEILQHGPSGLHLQRLQGEYPVGEMVRQRMEVLRNRGFVTQDNGVWRLSFMGETLARITAFVAWLYQAPGQHERN